MQMSAMLDHGKKRRWAIAVEVKDVASGAKMSLQREKLIDAARGKRSLCR